MATLVLTTIGTIVGGPIGGAIGALIGQQADQRLFAPKGRQGPQLNDLSLQTSTYGQPIPKIFGTMRAAGTVIWATDLKEDKHKSGGGKGAPKATTYSYSASFAVALSARPIRAVRRIWADGKLLRGAAGDWKSQTGFRLYTGTEGQPIDPLIAAIEGTERAPAYRGIAYVVFEDLQLADFGNRIPSLTFEIEADEVAVTVGAIAGELSDGAVGGATAMAVGGYAASGESVRGALDLLASAGGILLVDDGEVLRMSDGGGPLHGLTEEELGAAADGKRVSRRVIDRQASGTLPDEIAVAYYEASRDYQAGLQRARRGGPGRRVEKIELPASISADVAKGCAERRLGTIWGERAQATIALPWRRIGLRPGDRVAIPGIGAQWRIKGWTLDRMVTELKLVGVPSTAPAAQANPGRSTPGTDAAHGPSVVHLLDLPVLREDGGNAARLWAVANGPGAGWRRAEISVSLDDGASWTAIGPTAAPALIGEAVDVLGGGSSMLIDRVNSVEIELLNAAMWLESRDDAALISGANLAMLGDELIQFGRAEQTGPRRFRLSRLLRGRRGSEWAMTSHHAGERFVLIEAETLRPIEVSIPAIGSAVRIMAAGIGDGDAPAEAQATFLGRSLRPPPPVRLRASRLSDGAIRISWTRRSRTGWSWLDGNDAPLGEETERYRMTISASIGVPRTIETALPHYDYGPAEQTADGSTAATNITIDLVQLGSIAASLPAVSATFDI